MAAPIEFGFFERLTFASGNKRFPLGLLVHRQGLSQGEKNGTLSGIESQILRFPVLMTAQNTVLASTIFSLDVCRELTCRMTGRFHPPVELNELGLDCLIAIHDVRS